MWSTTTEGHPISPVFDSPEKLAYWLAENKASTFGYETTTYENWLKMIDAGWAMTMVSKNGEIKSGVDAVAEWQKEKEGVQANGND